MTHLSKFFFGFIFLLLTGCGGGNSTDGGVSGSGSTVNPNAPIADAGFGQTVAVGAAVQLNGSFSSSAGGKALAYSWTLSSKPAGSNTALVSGTTVTPMLVPDTVGTYVVSLVVNDGTLSSKVSAISLIAIPGASPVLAHAGPAQSVLTQSTVTLTGASSSSNTGRTLSYSWTLTTRPVGSKATLSAEKTVTPSFFADVAGTYLATLTVSDGSFSSQPSIVTIVAGASRVAPVANTGGAQSVLTGTTVQLSGSASTSANRSSLSYSWTLSSKPAGSAAALSALTVASPTFFADVNGVYIATLIVSDGVLFSQPVSIVITAANLNPVPVANAGAAQSGFTGVKVMLDGSQSQSLSGIPLSYKWALTARPPGSTTQLVSSEMVGTSFVPDVAGSYVATLLVSDGKMTSQPSTVLMTIAQSALTLTSINTSQGNQLLPWPYTDSVSKLGSVACVDTVCADFTVASFQLQGTGRPFTIANLAAVNLTENTSVTASIAGLKNGQIIPSGQAVAFQLIAQATSGQTIDLLYTFSIVETGNVFSYTVRLKTN